ncbi:MAG: hypothetical protein U0263_38770 [Polyangiaceae bacterium]
MLLVQALGFGLILPALVAFAFVLALGAREPGEPRFLAWLAPALGLGLAYVAAHLAIHGPRGILPADTMQRLPLVAGAAVLLSLADRAGAKLAWRLLVDAAVAGIAAGLLLSPLTARGDKAPPLALVFGVFVLGAVLVMRASTALVPSERPLAGAVALGVLSGALSGLAALSGTALVGQLGGAAAAGVGGLTLALFVRKRASLESAGRVVGALFASVLGLAYFYAEMRPEVLALGVAAALAFGGAAVALRKRPALGLGLGLLIGGGLLGVAGYRALRPAASTAAPSPASSSENATDNDYGYQ